MLNLRVNKKLLQNHLSKKLGQVILLKDLHNIGSSSRDGCSIGGIDKAVEELKKIPGNYFFLAYASIKFYVKHSITITHRRMRAIIIGGAGRTYQS